MIVANTRIPYKSAFVQLEKDDDDDDKYNTKAPNGVAKDKDSGQPGPALPGPAPFVRGEKQWMDNAFYFLLLTVTRPLFCDKTD